MKTTIQVLLRLLAEVAAVAIFLWGLDAFAQATKPSFDCAQAAQPVEKLICSNDELAALDAKLATVFSKMLADHPDQAQDLKRDEREWVKTRGERPDWLSSQYQQRIQELQSPEKLLCDKPVQRSEKITMICNTLNAPRPFSITLEGKVDDGMIVGKSILTQEAGYPAKRFSIQFDYSGSELNFENALSLMDVNFDGFPDIQLNSGENAPNANFSYWLYDPQVHGFIRREDLDVLSGSDVEAHPESKELSASSSGSYAETTTQTFHWVGDRLVRDHLTKEGGVSGLDFDAIIYGHKHLDKLIDKLFRDVPKDHNPEFDFCATWTDSFNGKGLLVSSEVEPSDFCRSNDMATDLSTLRNYLKKNQVGFFIKEIASNHLIVLYDPPRANAVYP